MTATAVSAHRGGCEDARPATTQAYESAAALGADFIELDIRRTRDGELVVYHNAEVRRTELSGLSYEELCSGAGYPVPKVRDVMEIIAGRARGHLDLKEVGGESEVIKLALDILGAENFVATTLEDESIIEIKREFPDVVTALSLGRDRAQIAWPSFARTRLSELRPLRRMRACGADWLAVHQQLARLSVLRLCERHDIPIMVWTVNDEVAMRRLLADERVTVLITDHPRRALSLRAASG